MASEPREPAPRALVSFLAQLSREFSRIPQNGKLPRRLMVSCHRSFPRSESKTVLDSGFHAMDSGFQIVDFGAFVSGIWIPDSNRWRDSVSCIPDPKAQDSRFHKQKCSLHEAQLEKNIYCPNKVTRCSNSGIRKKTCLFNPESLASESGNTRMLIKDSRIQVPPTMNPESRST